jgi:dTDP-4-dehydrorhamnose 3,5-epimerase
MTQLDVQSLPLQGLLLLRPRRFDDERGFFSEVYQRENLRSFGIDSLFVQDNHVYSTRAGVLRGLHFQKPPRAQGKLVRCVRGAILDVAVDIRRGSPTFGQHLAMEISADNWAQIWVPSGFAHGYVTLTPDCEIIYKVTDYYSPEHEMGIAWDDPELAIDWRIDPATAILSPKDAANPRLARMPAVFDFEPGIAIA